MKRTVLFLFLLAVAAVNAGGKYRHSSVSLTERFDIVLGGCKRFMKDSISK